MSFSGRFLVVAALAAVGSSPSAIAMVQDCKSQKVTIVQAKVHEKQDVVDTAISADGFSTLVAAVKAAGLVEALKGEGPFTIFAPTDDAFAALPKGTLESLLEPKNRDRLTGILTYHVVPGRLMAKDVVKNKGLLTLNGQRLGIVASKDAVSIASSKILKTDIDCSNGVIHVIDSVMIPSEANLVQTAKKAKTFETLLAAAKAAGLADVLAKDGPFTIFAPTDDAFAALPEGTVENLLKPENRETLANILKLHVVSGRVYSPEAVRMGKAKSLLGEMLIIEVKDGKATVNGAGLIATDLDATNGVVHVIDRVILPSKT